MMFVTKYVTTVTATGTPAKATIPATTHKLERVNFVFVMPQGTSAASYAVNILSNNDVEIYASAANTSFRVIIC